MSESSAQAIDLSRWRIHFDRALARDAVGDLMVLVEEAPTRELQLEGRRLLARRLSTRRLLHLAREQLEVIVRLAPSDAASRESLTHMQTDGSAEKGSPQPSPSQPGSGSPARVCLFSGHMIDAPNRTTPRFPPDKEPIAARAIAEALDRIEAGLNDLAMCGGACGGDILFAEACLARGLHLHLHLPFEEPEFLAASVTFAGGRWAERYDGIASHPRATLRVMPHELGPSPAATNPYERNNRWQLSCALATGPVQLIALWNGQGGDGPGGTKHMVDTVKKYSGQAIILDTTALW